MTCARLLVLVRKDVTTKKVQAYANEYLRQRFGPLAYDDLGLKEFEEDVWDIYTALLDPEIVPYFNWETVAQKWNLQETDVALLRTFYSLQIFEQHPTLMGSKGEEIALFLKLLRKDHLKQNVSFRQRVRFYEQRLGEMSVPEMAQEQGLSEASVRREINDLGLSIFKAFRGDMGDGSTQAQQFIRHYVGIEPRGEPWSRLLRLRGHGPQVEADLLVLLKDEGLSHQEIADTLNQSVVHSGRSDYLRTAVAVAQKLAQMGYARPHHWGELHVSIAPYGTLKKSGVLDPLKAPEYLMDHRHLDVSTLAQRLDISREGLRTFLKRHHLLEFFEAPTGTAENVAELKAKLPALRKRLAKIQLTEKLQASLLDHMAQSGTFPILTDPFWSGVVNFSKVVGGGDYSDGGPLQHKRLFLGRNELMESLEKYFYKNTPRPYTPQERANILAGIQDGFAIAKAVEDLKKNTSLSKEEKKKIFFESILDRMLETGIYPTHSDPYWIDAPVKLPALLKGDDPIFNGNLQLLKAIEENYKEVIKSFDEGQQDRIQTALHEANQLALSMEKRAKRNPSLSSKVRKNDFFDSFLKYVSKNRISMEVTTDEFWQTSTVGFEQVFGLTEGRGNFHKSPVLAVRALEKYFSAHRLNFNQQQQDNIQAALRTCRDWAKKIQPETNIKPFNKEEKWEAFSKSILDFMAEAGIFPSNRNSFWKDSPVPAPQAFGLERFADGKIYQSRALRNSRIEGIESLQADFEKSRKNYSLEQQQEIQKGLDQGFVKALKEQTYLGFESLESEEQREIMNRLILKSMAETGVYPRSKDPFWRDAPAGVMKFYGIGQNAPGEKFADSALNQGREMAIGRIRETLEIQTEAGEYSEPEMANILQALAAAPSPKPQRGR